MLEPAPQERPDWISEARHGTDVVNGLLEELAIPRETLEDAVRSGVTERRRATRFEPTTSAGLRDWLTRVGTLREQLHRTGWRPTDPANAPMTRRPDGTVLLGVMQGDEGTGDLGKELSSTYPKGATVAKLTLSNDTVNQPLPGIDDMIGRGDIDAGKTWFLVTHFVDGDADSSATVQVEIAQPAPTRSGTNITDWAKRCCLHPIEFTPVAEPDETRGVEVPVSWRDPGQGGSV